MFVHRGEKRTARCLQRVSKEFVLSGISLRINTLLTRCEQRAVRYFTMRTHNLSTLPCNENRTPLLAVRYLGRDTLPRLFALDKGEQALGGILKEVEDVVEIFGTTVIRVGDGGEIVV